MPVTSRNRPAQSIRRTTRSVAGCLTCRRRKVKCSSRSIPCDHCSRLSLQCESSFDRNFKPWTAEGARESDTRSPKELGTRANATLKATAELQAASASMEADQLPWANLPSYEEPFNLLDFIFSDLATEITPMDLNLRTPATAATPFPDYWPMLRTGDLMGNAPTCDPMAATSTGDVPESAMLGRRLDPTSDEVIYRVPHLMSTKESIWTCFHYLVNSAKAIPNSPLCHAILGWIYAYLAQNDPSSVSRRAEHYDAASDAIRELSEGLLGSRTTLGRWAWKMDSVKDQLSLYFSSTFFACQHDLMTGELASFMARIRDAAAIFQRHWAEGITPGAVESRIVIWLAFLELRAIFFLQGCDFPGSAPDKDFISILTESNALPTLRRGLAHTSVLTKCFGNGVPQEEEDDDLRKDECRIKYDDLMYYLASIRQFEAWDKEHMRHQGPNAALLEQLRQAKIDVLQANLARIHAEYEQAFPTATLCPPKNQPIDSVTFHKFTADALRCCATILCRRIVAPGDIGDPASQAAAAEIVRISRLLRQTKRLQSPRSTIWPLPLFIAGMESTDGVYQDWILDYMKELRSWGVHVQKAAEALERIITLQESTGSRARIFSSIEDKT